MASIIVFRIKSYWKYPIKSVACQCINRGPLCWWPASRNMKVELGSLRIVAVCGLRLLQNRSKLRPFSKWNIFIKNYIMVNGSLFYSFFFKVTPKLFVTQMTELNFPHSIRRVVCSVVFLCRIVCHKKIIERNIQTVNRTVRLCLFAMNHKNCPSDFQFVESIRFVKYFSVFNVKIGLIWFLYLFRQTGSDYSYGRS